MRMLRCDFPGCDREFSKSCNLKAHKRLHTGEKPFVCSVVDCDKSFMWKSSLKSHEKSHEREKNKIGFNAVKTVETSGDGVKRGRVGASEIDGVSSVQEEKDVFIETAGEQIAGFTFANAQANDQSCPLSCSSDEKVDASAQLIPLQPVQGDNDVALVSLLMAKSMSIGETRYGDALFSSSGAVEDRLGIEVEFVTDETGGQRDAPWQYCYSIDVSPVPSPMMSRAASKLIERLESRSEAKVALERENSRMMMVSRGNSRSLAMSVDVPMSRENSLYLRHVS